MSKQKAFKEFQCPFCNKMFTNRGLQGHVRFIHQKEVRVVDGEIVGLDENLPEKTVASEINHEINHDTPVPEIEEEPVETNDMEFNDDDGSLGNYWICPDCGKEHWYPPGVFGETHPLHPEIICSDCTEEEPYPETEEEPYPDIEVIQPRRKDGERRKEDVSDHSKESFISRYLIF